MSQPSPGIVTRLLNKAGDAEAADHQATDRLLALVFGEARRRQYARTAGGPTFHPPALVREIYLGLLGQALAAP